MLLIIITEGSIGLGVRKNEHFFGNEVILADSVLAPFGSLGLKTLRGNNTRPGPHVVHTNHVSGDFYGKRRAHANHNLNGHLTKAETPTFGGLD